MMSVLINASALTWVLSAFLTGSLIGFAFRSRQISKSKRRILELETEMVENHAEILRLHKHNSEMADETSVQVPVISLSISDSGGPKTKVKA